MSEIIPTATYIIPTHPSTYRSSEQKIAVNRYSDPKPTPGRAKIAIVFAHANGYHKELWGPVLRRVRGMFCDGKAYELEFWSESRGQRHCEREADARKIVSAELAE
ncbi:hypothetical protein BC937DRAFT_94948, partial [Endogone sp. FLAS-F59071]